MDQILNLGNISLDYSLPAILTNLALSFILGLFIALIYRKTHSGLSYSQSFVFTLVILTVSGAVLIMIVGNSLARAFSLFGAFSIIRFRTAVKDVKDITYVFLALIIGMAVGTNNYQIALVSTGVLAVIIMILHKFNFGSLYQGTTLIQFTYDQSAKTENQYQQALQKADSQANIINLQSLNTNKLVISYAIDILEKQQTELVKQLNRIKGISQIHLTPLHDPAEL
jgi:hypothetical protein